MHVYRQVILDEYICCILHCVVIFFLFVQLTVHCCAIFNSYSFVVLHITVHMRMMWEINDNNNVDIHVKNVAIVGERN